MSLKAKYTWAKFKSIHPEVKHKRTSKEGQDAYEKAFKEFKTKYLKERVQQYEGLKKKAEKKLADTQAQVKRVNKKTPGTKFRRQTKVAAKLAKVKAAIKSHDQIITRSKAV